MAKFIRAYNTETGAPQEVPERWLDHPVLGANLRRTPPPDAVDPSIDTPSMDWTVDQLAQHAAEQGIDLTGVSKKADIVATIHNPTHAPAAGDENQE